jgi:transcriptional regulator with XRE-family HTH domain
MTADQSPTTSNQTMFKNQPTPILAAGYDCSQDHDTSASAAPPSLGNRATTSLSMYAALVRPSGDNASQQAANDGDVFPLGQASSECEPDPELDDVGRADAVANLKQPHLTPDRALAANVVGPRIVAARELNGIQQLALAKALGYANSAHLSQVEAGRRAPSLCFLISVCKILAVSTDWVLGLSDEPDFDPQLARRTALQRSVRAQLDSVVGVLTDAFDRHHATESPVRVQQLIDHASAMVEAFTRFHVRNGEGFPDMPAGAPLAHAARQLAEHVEIARELLRRHSAFDAGLRVSLDGLLVRGQHEKQVVRLG